MYHNDKITVIIIEYDTSNNYICLSIYDYLLLETTLIL